MYEKYLQQLKEAGKISNLKERSINCCKNYVSYLLNYMGKAPEELTCQDVREFLLLKKEEGLKATTFNLYNSAICIKPCLQQCILPECVCLKSFTFIMVIFPTAYFVQLGQIENGVNERAVPWNAKTAFSFTPSSILIIYQKSV